MQHGFIAIEDPVQKGLPIWRFAAQENDDIAIFAEMATFSSPDGQADEWRETLVGSAGMVSIHGTPREYGRYHPQHEAQFVAMCGHCRYHDAFVTHSDVSNSLAMELIEGVWRSEIEINKSIDAKGDVGRLLQFRMYGARWAYLVGHSHPALARTFFLASSAGRLAKVKEIAATLSYFHLQEEWLGPTYLHYS